MNDGRAGENSIPEGRSALQSLCIPAEGIPDGLYFYGPARIKNAGVYIPRGKRVTFDTYFNLFPLFKWRHYTRIRDLDIEIVLKGEAEISLVGISRKKKVPPADGGQGGEDKEAFRAEKTEWEETILCRGRVFAEKMDRLQLFTCRDLSGLPDFLYVSVTALDSGAEIGDIRFLTRTERKENLNFACCFCTYKREEDIRRNIDSLLSGIVHRGESALSRNLQIYAADNGQTLPEDLYADEPAVHIFPNRNYGGSAGFTRCMIEACFRNPGGPFTHLILMDDDARILPESVERTAAFLGFLKEEYRSYMIGGAQFDRDVPSVQEENGAVLDFRRVDTHISGAHWDLCSREKVLENECSRESEANYNGWWYTCIPAELIREDNLPLPCFLHRDDEEYGIRNGGKFIRLNGICVWHPNLRGITKTNPGMDYYNWRNILIAQAAHCPDRNARDMLALLTRAVGMHLLNYNYAGARCLCRGFENFYSGIDAFRERDAEKCNREVMKMESYEPCRLTRTEMAEAGLSGNERAADSREQRGDPSFYTEEQLRKRKMETWLLPASRKRRIYSEGHTWRELDYYRTKEICVVNPETGEGIRLQKNYRRAFAVLGYYLKVCFLVLRKHRKVYGEWTKRVRELQTLEFWEEYLGL